MFKAERYGHFNRRTHRSRNPRWPEENWKNNSIRVILIEFAVFRLACRISCALRWTLVDNNVYKIWLLMCESLLLYGYEEVFGEWPFTVHPLRNALETGAPSHF